MRVTIRTIIDIFLGSSIGILSLEASRFLLTDKIAELQTSADIGFDISFESLRAIFPNGLSDFLNKINLIGGTYLLLRSNLFLSSFSSWSCWFL
jgi:hypothetical protein